MNLPIDKEKVRLEILRGLVKWLADYEEFTSATGEKLQRLKRMRLVRPSAKTARQSARKALNLINRHPYRDCLDEYLPPEDVKLIDRMQRELKDG
jgi:hypothetical protein